MATKLTFMRVILSTLIGLIYIVQPIKQISLLSFVDEFETCFWCEKEKNELLQAYEQMITDLEYQLIPVTEQYTCLNPDHQLYELIIENLINQLNITTDQNLKLSKKISTCYKVINNLNKTFVSRTESLRNQLDVVTDLNSEFSKERDEYFNIMNKLNETCTNKIKELGAEKGEYHKNSSIFNQTDTDKIKELEKQISNMISESNFEEDRALKCRNLQKGYIYTPKIGCHKVVSWQKKSWTAAQKDCQRDGETTDLAIFNSDDEAEIISERLGVNEDYHDPYAWIGIKSDEDAKMWVTVHGELLSSTGYTKGKDEGSYEDTINQKTYSQLCMSQRCHPEIGLFKESCTKNLYYICELHYTA